MPLPVELRPAVGVNRQPQAIDPDHVASPSKAFFLLVSDPTMRERRFGRSAGRRSTDVRAIVPTRFLG